jgi:hypothetical protein
MRSSSIRSWPQKPVPGDRGSDRAGHQRQACVSRPSGLGVRLLRLEGPARVAQDAEADLARRRDHGRPPRFWRHVRSAESRCGVALRAQHHRRAQRDRVDHARARSEGRSDSPAAEGRRVGNLRSLDLVRRSFARKSPNQLWMTDITEHPTREGKTYCCVVLHAFSRLVVGWSARGRRRSHPHRSATVPTARWNRLPGRETPTSATLAYALMDVPCCAGSGPGCLNARWKPACFGALGTLAHGNAV